MQLSDFAPEFYRVVCNGQFETPRLMIGELTDYNLLVFALDKQYFRRAYENEHVSAIICNEKCIEDFEFSNCQKGIAVCSNPKYAFYSIHNLLARNDLKYCGLANKKTVIGQNTIIHETAIISSTDVEIGSNCTIGANVIIKRGVSIGNGAVIGDGVIIGIDNLVDCKDDNGNLLHIDSVGTVKIGDNFVIGPYATVARGWMSGGITEIGNHVFLGAKILIGHDVKLGNNCDIKDNTLVAGYTEIGENTNIAVQCVISNKLKIGKNVDIVIGSVVVSNVPDGSEVAGNFAIDKKKFLMWHLKKLSIGKKVRNHV